MPAKLGHCRGLSGQGEGKEEAVVGGQREGGPMGGAAQRDGKT